MMRTLRVPFTTPPPQPKTPSPMSIATTAAGLNLTRSPLFVIAGPCVIESADLCLTVGRHVKSVCDQLGLVYVFKASFDKANRSSSASFRGPGIGDGLAVLDRVKRELNVPVLTDIHEP